MIGMTEAAKLTGKQRQTIHKAIKEGRISATRGESGEWRIDPAELFRVYPPASTVNDNQSDKVDAGLQRVDSGLQREVELLRERIREKNDIIDDLRQDRDHWRQQATALLTDRREPAASVGRKIELRTLARPRFLLALLAVMGLAVLVLLLRDRVAVLVDML